MTRVLVLVAALVVTACLALWWRRREGRVVRGSDRFTRAQLAALGVPPGASALVEFTAPHCAPCASARRVLDEVAATYNTLVVTADAGHEVARAHRVLRAPTTFVLAADGAVRGRISGVPARDDVVALVTHPPHREERVYGRPS